MRKSTGWTKERRAKQAEAIKAWTPWARSTGPKTETGKAKASRNAYKGEAWKKQRELFKSFNELFRQQQENLDEICGRM